MGDAQADLRRAVQQYRKDPWSRLADKFGAARDAVGRVQAVAYSRPRIAAALTFLTRCVFLADVGSDIQVGLSLRSSGNPTWGTIVLALVLVPYICLAVILAEHASEQMKNRWGIPQLLGKVMWLVASFPVLLLTDVFLISSHMCRLPSSTRAFHYLNLRKMVEVAETVPQLMLQGYIYVRLSNPFRIFPSVSGASVDWRMLLVSIAFSSYNLLEIRSFIVRFSRVQGHGSPMLFLRRMSRLGEGLAPSALFEALEKQKVVKVEFDLKTTSYAELRALGQTAARSTVLQELHFTDGSFVQEHLTSEIRNMIGDVLLARSLVELSLGPGVPQSFYDEAVLPAVQGMFEQHPKLRVLRVDGFDEQRGQDPTVASSTLGVVEAARKGDAANVEALLAGASPEERQQSLATSVPRGHLEVLRTLLSHPTSDPMEVANQPVTALGHRPLHIAAGWRQTTAAGLLLVARADPNGQDGFRQASAVWQAACVNSEEVLEQLLAARGDPNLQGTEGTSPVTIAAQQNSAEAAKLLLEAHGDPNLQTNEGESGVFCAACDNAVEVLRYLLAARGNPDLQMSDGRSPVYIAGERNAVEAMELLLASGGDPNVREGNYETTPLHITAMLNNSQALDLLLKARGDPSITMQDGRTPLDLATEKDSTEAAAILQATTA